jgi:hypothetical protein
MTSEQSAYGQYTIAGEGRKPREYEEMKSVNCKLNCRPPLPRQATLRVLI